ncbi:hypothetical protein AA20_02495 [Aliarcobacter butzleri L348]|uniref:Uncharacterized protein n=1 Tax=Aliarcobacter butzleri L348 TaxID=1447256 RepID=A0A0G9K7J3_9BACT|nr:hypothetical protein AA20_02495 [Aliarcobacter butzleri L348]
MNNKTNYSFKITKITKNSNFAFSNNIFESRFKENKNNNSNLVLIPLEISYLDFVYEK